MNYCIIISGILLILKLIGYGFSWWLVFAPIIIGVLFTAAYTVGVLITAGRIHKEIEKEFDRWDK